MRAKISQISCQQDQRHTSSPSLSISRAHFRRHGRAGADTGDTAARQRCPVRTSQFVVQDLRHASRGTSPRSPASLDPVGGPCEMVCCASRDRPVTIRSKHVHGWQLDSSDLFISTRAISCHTDTSRAAVRGSLSGPERIATMFWRQRRRDLAPRLAGRVQGQAAGNDQEGKEADTDQHAIHRRIPDRARECPSISVSWLATHVYR